MITTSVIGDLFIVHDPNGQLETVVGEQPQLDWLAIYNLLRGSFGDHYDFVSFYLDVGSGVINIGAAAITIYQDAAGIGRWTAANGFDFRADWGTTKLQHLSYFATNLPNTALPTVLHEIGHRWLAHVNYALTDPGPAQRLLHEDWVWDGQQGVHWGRWPDKRNSSMSYDRAEWIDNGDGTFNRLQRDYSHPAHDEWFGYSPLDQYLMGLLPPSAVAPFVIVRDPSPGISWGVVGSTTGPHTPNPSALTVTIEQVRNRRSDEPMPFSGPRNPDHFNSQRVFHEAVIVVTKNAGTSTPFISNVDDLRKLAAANFRRVTSGRAMIDPSLLRANYTGLYVKDNPADTGTGTSSPPFWLSPDLWVRNLDDGGLVHQPTIRMQSNWIYVRVRNKSAQAYENVTVNVYLANFQTLVPGTEFLYPVDWNPEGLLGSVPLASVPASSGGIEGEAIAKVEWTADRIPAATGWHPCLLCEVIPMEVTPSGLHHVFENRKLAQRNISIIDPAAMPGAGAVGGGFMFGYSFSIGHELRPTRSAVLRLRAERHAPQLRLFLDPGGLVSGLRERATELSWDVPLNDGLAPDGAEGVVPVAPASEPLVTGRRSTPRGCLTAFWAVFGVLLEALGLRSGLRRHRLRGLRPILLNGLPLLEVMDAGGASARLFLPAGQRRTLRLFGVASSGAEVDVPALYHVSEEVDGRTVGGVSVEVRF
jgi:hypothetical protein